MTLVLIRHGESTWNATNQFCGWVDVDLAEGALESDGGRAANALSDLGIEFDVN